MSTATDTRARRQVRVGLSLFMALDALELATQRITALRVKAINGTYSDALHMEAVGNLDRVLMELSRARAEAMLMPDEADGGES